MSTRNALSENQLSQVTGGSAAYDTAYARLNDLFLSYQQNGKTRNDFLTAVNEAYPNGSWNVGLEGTEAETLQTFINEWGNTLGR